MSYTKDRSVTVGYDRKTYLSNAVPTDSVARTIRTLKRTRTGENNPQWKTQVKRQTNAGTPMSGVYDELTAEFAQAETAWVGYFGNAHPVDKCIVSGYLLLGAHSIDWLPSITTLVADGRARLAFFKAVKKAQSSFSGLTFLGEMREAFRMIRRPALGLRGLADAWISRVKREKHRVPANWKKNLSSMWLEQAFGWQPLVNDINSAYETFRRFHDRRDQVPVSGFGKEEMLVPTRCEYGSLGSLGPIGGLINYRYNRISREAAVVKYRGMVRLWSTGTLAGTLQPFGFTFDEFVPTAWELLPWSFLVDYFSNIGDVISAGTVSYADLGWCNVSAVKFQTSELAGYNDTKNTHGLGSNYLYSIGSNAYSKYTRRSVQRSVNVVVERPTLTFEIPGLPTQWANLTALFANANAIHPQRRWGYTLKGYGLRR